MGQSWKQRSWCLLVLWKPVLIFWWSRQWKNQFIHHQMMGFSTQKWWQSRVGGCDIFSRSRKDTRRRGMETKPSKQHVWVLLMLWFWPSIKKWRAASQALLVLHWLPLRITVLASLNNTSVCVLVCTCIHRCKLSHQGGWQELMQPCLYQVLPRLSSFFRAPSCFLLFKT